MKLPSESSASKDEREKSMEKRKREKEEEKKFLVTQLSSSGHGIKWPIGSQ
jgi:hypothetical protein